MTAKKKTGAKARRAATKVKVTANRAKPPPPGSVEDGVKVGVESPLLHKDLVPSPPTMSVSEKEQKVTLTEGSSTFPTDELGGPLPGPLMDPGAVLDRSVALGHPSDMLLTDDDGATTTAPATPDAAPLDDVVVLLDEEIEKEGKQEENKTSAPKSNCPGATTASPSSGSHGVQGLLEATTPAVATTVGSETAVIGNTSIFDRLKGKRLADEAKRLASSPGARLQWDQYKIKPVVKPDVSRALTKNKKGFGIHVAVIPGEGFCVRFDNYKVQKCLNDLIWKNLRGDTLTPSEEKISEDMRNAGFISRAYTWIDNGEVQKSFMNTQLKLFFLLSENTSSVTKEDMVAFFGSLCDNFINQLPVSVENNIVTSVNEDSFLWKEEAGYSELIGTEAAMTRFKYEVKDMTEIPDPSKWFCENKEEVFKYFRPGTWTIEVALLFQPPEYEQLLSTSELEEMRKMEMGVAENSGTMDASSSVTPVHAMGKQTLLSNPG